ncbi:hypothetical protein OAR38_00495 [Flavobacteriaceae bacterium]|jgi:hypothetical protein|nr:hypothetical protein [Flavobacteriaceae bacterium]MDB4239369.1 hypothetical protein [Flavobacteriaceae bacterium]MDB9787757.1 hypothetical protein [Flavobacteriaceae bacterium]MDB9902095.1 hypothetical protein [Flavobacteriaceae bacterium]MDC0958023.1 hypothetical protein [Flavobacteriaceae bacterium]
MKKTLTLLILLSFISCQDTFSEIKNIKEIEGDWESELESISVDTDKMIITVNDTVYLVLTSRHYDKPLITVSSGSVMYYDARVSINESKNSIKIKRINEPLEITYLKK